jgi:cation:H+ antiporter
LDIILILGGFVALLIGGEALVKGAVETAQRLRVSPMVIGLTLVGFGTSTPELLTSLQAALDGAPGIAVGNVVGSNIANILLIVGLSALIAPIAVGKHGFRQDMGFMIGATALFMAIASTGHLGRFSATMLLLGLALFLVLAFRRSDADAPQIEAPKLSMPVALLYFIGGLLITLLGARFLVQGAIGLAEDMGVSQTVIGLTIVAVGTSLPELVTSVLAARRGHSDVALGNIVGSNIFNILGILGATALVKPIPIPSQIVAYDNWVMLGASLLLIGACVTQWRISRAEGAVMLGLYGAYIVTLAV